MMALENEKQLHTYFTIDKYYVLKINNVSFFDISPILFEVNYSYV